MTVGKAFVFPEGSFYIVDAQQCPECGKVQLIYTGCTCNLRQWNDLKAWIINMPYTNADPSQYRELILAKMIELEK